MRLLLDTHAYIWWALGDAKRLSTKARKAIGAKASHIFFSAASAYELAYKHREGGLPKASALLRRLEEDLVERDVVQLAITLEHARRAGELADEHGDPFDRLLAAQSIVENMPIVTNDEKLAALGAKCIW